MGMADQKFKLRVTYQKIGNATWLSQLELARALEHAVRRSGLPYVVSEGYVPHMRISFGPALSVGIESKSQVFDVLLSRYIAPDKCLASLKKASADCLMPLDASYVDNNNGFETSGINSFEAEVKGKISSLDIPKQIEVVKKKKTKVLDVDKYLDGDVEISEGNGATRFCFKLKFYDEGSLNPEIFLKSVLENSGINAPEIINFKKL